MTECGLCGDCCEDILYHSHAALRTAFKRTGSMAPSAPFVLEHWHAVNKDAFIKSSVPVGKRRRARRELRGKSIYNCDRFDPVSRLCTAHDERPPVCAGFPFYDGGPIRDRIGGRYRCSYWWDIPPEEWPKQAKPIGFVPLAEVENAP